MNLIDIIPHLIIIFLGNILYSICFGKLINQKFKFNLRNILITIIHAILLYPINNIQHFIVKITICLILGAINYKLVFNCKIKEAFIGHMFIYSILMLLEMFYSNLYGILHIISNSNSTTYICLVKLIFSSITCITEYILFCLNFIKNKLIKIYKLLIRNTNLTNIVFLIFIVASILGITNIETFYKNGSIYLIISLVIIFAILFILIIKETTNVNFLKESNKKLTAYNDNYGRFLKEYKMYKHNINHKLKAVKVYGNKKVNALINDILNEESVFAIKNNDLYNLPNGIKGAIAERLYNTNLDVLVDNKIKGDPFKSLTARSFNETSTCLGIILDNAVEASEDVKNPVIVIDLKEDKENIYIKIGNKFKNDIDLIELGSLNYSTKNRESGFGLFSIGKSKKINEKINIINDFFYIELKISK